MRRAPRKVYIAPMIRIFLPLLCAALGFATASCTQSEEPLATAAAPATARPASHDAAAAAMPSLQGSSAGSSAQEASSDVSASPPVVRRASTLIAMPVVSADGSPLGDVKDIIFDRRGQATHLVIAYGSARPQGGADQIPGDGKTPAAGGGRRLTAIPWDAAMASLKDGQLVLDAAKLQGAPSFTPDTWPDLDDPAWSTATDTYWRKAMQAAIAAHPGTPVDSTSRERARPARDGN
jgi:sporulation protein YlmC with PRC-barrel domain